MRTLAGADAEALEALRTQALEWGGPLAGRNYHTAQTDNPSETRRVLNDPALVSRWPLVEGTFFRSAEWELGKRQLIEQLDGLLTHPPAGLKLTRRRRDALIEFLLERIEDSVGDGEGGTAGVDGILSPEQVADEVVIGLAAEEFLILPHKEVALYRQRKADDYDRWLGGMRKLRRHFGHPQ